jgi:hypothetical protein
MATKRAADGHCQKCNVCGAEMTWDGTRRTKARAFTLLSYLWLCTECGSRKTTTEKREARDAG